MKVRLVLSGFPAVVLKDIHALGIEGSGRRLGHFAHQTEYALDFTAPNVKNGLAMRPWYDEHGPSLVLPFVDLGHCVLILSNNCTVTSTGQVVAEAAGYVGRKLEFHGSE